MTSILCLDNSPKKVTPSFTLIYLKIVNLLIRMLLKTTPQQKKIIYAQNIYNSNIFVCCCETELNSCGVCVCVCAASRVLCCWRKRSGERCATLLAITTNSLCFMKKKPVLDDLNITKWTKNKYGLTSILTINQSIWLAS